MRIAVVIYDNEPEIGLKPFTLLPRGCPGEECGADWNDYKFPLTVNVTYEGAGVPAAKKRRRPRSSCR